MLPRLMLPRPQLVVRPVIPRHPPPELRVRVGAPQAPLVIERARVAFTDTVGVMLGGSQQIGRAHV